MKTFPLVRIKLSNERTMAALFIVLVLYLIPGWIGGTRSIVSFAVVLTAALFIDVVCSFIRFKQIVCAVSASITALIILVLCPGAPLPVLAAGTVVTLIVIKHLWAWAATRFGGSKSGTGKNLFNPALAAVLVISLLYPGNTALFEFSPFYLPAVILSIPFLLFRPFAGAGVMAAMAAASFFIPGALSLKIIFFGCVIVTDPVTITEKPAALLAGGFITFFAILFLSPYFPAELTSLCIAFLALNLLSFGLDELLPTALFRVNKPFRIKKITPYYLEKPEGDVISGLRDNSGISKKEILARIKKGEICGRGGGAFPLYKKICSVLDSGKENKYLVINAVECDPGLIHDRWLLEYFADQIIAGAAFLSKCMDFKKVVLAVKKNNFPTGLPDLLEKAGITFCKTGDFYPAGEEKILINKVLARELVSPMVPGSIPAFEGILMCNLQTVYALYLAVSENKKITSRYITLANFFSGQSKVIEVKPGENIHSIVKKEFGTVSPIFKGGGLMSVSPAKAGDVVDEKTTFLAASPGPNYRESLICSHCQLCSNFCPAGLSVSKIADLVDLGKTDRTLSYSPEKCLNCGLCSYVCLAGRNLAARVKKAAKKARESYRDV